MRLNRVIAWAKFGRENRRLVHGLRNNWITTCCLLCVSTVGAEDARSIRFIDPFLEKRFPGEALMSSRQDLAETSVRRLVLDLTTLEQNRRFVPDQSYWTYEKKVGWYLQVGAPEKAFATARVTAAVPQPETKTGFQRPTYDVLRASMPITLDGRMDEAAWHEADNMGPFHFTWWQNGKKKQTVAKMLWDDKYLYIGHICQDEYITARYKNHDDPVARDDCFEVMLAPDPERPEFYFNIEWNVRGAYIDGHRAHGPKKPSVPWVAEGVRIAGTYRGTLNDDSDKDQSWTCEVAIPLANFARYMKRKSLQPGDRWNLNLNRHGGDTNMQYSQWSRADTSKPSFHTPHRFGQVTFVNPPAQSDNQIECHP